MMCTQCGKTTDGATNCGDSYCQELAYWEAQIKTARRKHDRQVAASMYDIVDRRRRQAQGKE